jgi:hypothetical protein
MSDRIRAVIPRLSGREVEFGVPGLKTKVTLAEPERNILDRLFVVMGDKRAILDYYGRAYTEHVTGSIQQLRGVLTDTLTELGPDAVSAPAIRDVRAAVLEYLKAVEDHPVDGPEPVLFAPALRDLRQTVRAFAQWAATAFGLDSAAELVADMDQADYHADPGQAKLWQDPETALDR